MVTSAQALSLHFSFLLMCLTLSHLQRCVTLNLFPAVAGACGEGSKEGKRRNEQKSDSSFQVVACSLGKGNGHWLFKVSLIRHECSLQMDTYRSERRPGSCMSKIEANFGASEQGHPPAAVCVHVCVCAEHCLCKQLCVLKG